MRFDQRTQRWTPSAPAPLSRGSFTALATGGGNLWPATLKGIWRCCLPVGK